MTASGTRHGNLFWEEEKANVGLRMMQGMGWQQGSGLGARGHGMTSHIRVRQKKDNSGIGANAETRDDSWKATQDVFNSILTRLNSGSDAVDGADGDDGKTPTVKQTMARHALYRKFRQSKNASAYSSTDMAMIFGKREGERGEGGQAASAADTSRADATGADVPSGHQTTTATMSIRDYFAMRMQQSGVGAARARGAPGGFTEEYQAAFATEMTQRAEAYTGRQGLGFGGGYSGSQPPVHTPLVDAPEGAGLGWRAPAPPAGSAAGGQLAAAGRAARAEPLRGATGEAPAKPAKPSGAAGKAAAQQLGAAITKPNWKRAIRTVMRDMGPSAEGAKLKRFQRKLVQHLGGAATAERVERVLEKKLRAAGFEVVGKRIRALQGS